MKAPDTAKLWDAASKVIVLVSVVVAVCGLAWALALANETHALTVQNHALTVQIHEVVTVHTREIASTTALEKQVALVIDGLPAADKQLTAFAAFLSAELSILCAGHVPACPSPPSP